MTVQDRAHPARIAVGKLKFDHRLAARHRFGHRHRPAVRGKLVARRVEFLCKRGAVC